MKGVVWLVFLLLCLGLLGCSKVVVRDAKVYKQELGFIDAASEEVVDRSKLLIAQECTCESVGDVQGFSTEACHNLAETILVMEARIGYHTDMMRYLGEISKERPSREPPEVPEVSSLCSEEVE